MCKKEQKRILVGKCSILARFRWEYILKTTVTASAFKTMEYDAFACNISFALKTERAIKD